MKPDEKQLENALKGMLTALENYASSEDVAKVFETLMEAMKGIKEHLDSRLGEMDTKLASCYSDMEKCMADMQTSKSEMGAGLTSGMSEVRATMLSEGQKLLKLIESLPKPQVIDVQALKEDATGDIMSRVLPLIPKIKGLVKKDEVEKMIKEAIRRIPKIGANYSDGRAVRAYDIPTLNGVTKSFYLPAFWRVWDVKASSSPWNLKRDVDYTIDASTYQITFTSQITAESTLASDQTVTVYYVEN